MKNPGNYLRVIAFTLLTMYSTQMLAQLPESTGNASSTKGKARMEKREEMKAKVAEIEAKLNLAPEQAAKIKEIKQRNTDEAKGKIMALPADASREDRMKIMKEAMDNADQEILEILNSEQQAIYKAEKEKLKEEMKEKRKSRKRG
ncbi:MAG: hypothetical protein Q8M15_03855 [Bacteroidota bacterium]|nr:hypothetical protein [Bacteroidota bacterium]